MALAATVFILDLHMYIWGESGEREEQFGAPFDPVGPSGRYGYFGRPYLGGRGSEPVGRRGPETSPKVSYMTRGTYGAPS